LNKDYVEMEEAIELNKKYSDLSDIPSKNFLKQAAAILFVLMFIGFISLQFF